MNAVIYLYDHFPYAEYIKNESYDKLNNITKRYIINKEEINNYIFNNNIELNKWDKDNCPCSLLYQNNNKYI